MNKDMHELLTDLSLYKEPNSLSMVRQRLSTYITLLIQEDFDQLIEILYRIDINEKRLKALLANDVEANSAFLITDLIIERQLQKLAMRQAQKPDPTISEEERW